MAMKRLGKPTEAERQRQPEAEEGSFALDVYEDGQDEGQEEAALVAIKGGFIVPFGKREDRIRKYLEKYAKHFVFDTFSPGYLQRSEKFAFMEGVPIPLRKEDLQGFKQMEGLEIRTIAENMAWIMGCNPEFPYNAQYIEFMVTNYNRKAAEGLMKEGRDEAEKGLFDAAAVHLRAALLMEPANFHMIYTYARICREQYLKSNNPEVVGRYKAESIDYFELLTEVKPDFANGYYYLGFAYLNMGLYIKAHKTWELYLEHAKNRKDRKEIKEKMAALQTPMEIEAGCNHVMAGRWQQGAELLEPYLNTPYKDWWPLSYYLGVVYERTGRDAPALKSWQNVLKNNPSHLETMEELVKLCRKMGDKEGETKYRKKLMLIRSQLAKAEKAAGGAGANKAGGGAGEAENEKTEE